MIEVRVTSLTIIDEPKQGIVYVLEPGTTSWIWDTTLATPAFVLFENRAPHIQYPQVFKDLATKVDPETGKVIFVKPPTV